MGLPIQHGDARQCRSTADDMSENVSNSPVLSCSLMFFAVCQRQLARIFEQASSEKQTCSPTRNTSIVHSTQVRTREIKIEGPETTSRCGILSHAWPERKFQDSLKYLTFMAGRSSTWGASLQSGSYTRSALGWGPLSFVWLRFLDLTTLDIWD